MPTSTYSRKISHEENDRLLRNLVFFVFGGVSSAQVAEPAAVINPQRV
jgi:hypothetical protein